MVPRMAGMASQNRDWTWCKFLIGRIHLMTTCEFDVCCTQPVGDLSLKDDNVAALY